MKLLLVVALLVSSVPVGAQTQAETSADVLRRLLASRPRVTAAPALPRLRRIVIIRPAAPARVKQEIPRRRLDGTLLSEPRRVYGFTPHNWQWWYQRDLRR